jgi:glycosidase
MSFTLSNVNKAKLTFSAVAFTCLLACSPTPTAENTKEVSQVQTKPAGKQDRMGKPIVYQVFTRLFGNQNSTNKPWGTITENGVGKFSDFNDTALQGIKQLGVSHIWYTGVPHHDVINDYTAYGIGNDDPDIVKGRAGSPYAVKDYYNVNPDLADDPAQRLAEFEALIKRTHQHGMQVIIDIVPNHVARNYHSISHPDQDFGLHDDTSVEYAKDNNFYYVVGQDFKVPEAKDGYQPLGGEKHPQSDGKFTESPAKWTGNSSRKAQPDSDDWYETVKINYGVKPDGSHDFPSLPEDYRNMDYAAHFAFWADKSVPDSWVKYRDIALYWLDKGVDGFRYDVAELVPVEFWSYLNSAIKQRIPDAFLMAEVYNPALYRDFIQLGKMDYLYDKVETYDALKAIIQGKADTSILQEIQAGLQDIEHNMLHFLENHDEQRITSPEFAGSADKAKPAMVVSTLNSSSPTMLYFAQEVGEDGSEDAGFGKPSRTSIFDYVGVPSHQRWMNGGKFDGGGLSNEEASLREFYERLLNIAANNSAMQGGYQSLHSANIATEELGQYDQRVFSFVRWQGKEKLIVVSNFDSELSHQFDLQLPGELVMKWALHDGRYQLIDLLADVHNDKTDYALSVYLGSGTVPIKLAPLQSVVLELR